MTADVPFESGDTGTVAQLSLCAGGLLRTWTADGPPKLWSVSDATYLHSLLGTGALARMAHERSRFREVAIVSVDSSTLWVQSRCSTSDADVSAESRGTAIKLQPAGVPTETTYEDVRAALTQAIAHAVANGEYLLVERGGWSSSTEPFCLFTIVPDADDHVSVIETSPDPCGSEIWAPYLVGDGESVTLSAPVEAAPSVMLDAIGTWNLAPWDLALTFGTHGH